MTKRIYYILNASVFIAFGVICALIVSAIEDYFIYFLCGIFTALGLINILTAFLIKSLDRQTQILFLVIGIVSLICSLISVFYGDLNDIQAASLIAIWLCVTAFCIYYMEFFKSDKIFFASCFFIFAVVELITKEALWGVSLFGVCLTTVGIFLLISALSPRFNNEISPEEGFDNEFIEEDLDMVYEKK